MADEIGSEDTRIGETFEGSRPEPRKGDQLFRSDVDWWHNAVLSNLDSGWALYAEGYKIAADVLVERVKHDRSEADFLVFPIVFLYRQYLELRLKEIIRDGSRLLDSPQRLPKDHRLDKLWSKCRRILEQVWPEGPAEHLDAVEECIHEFSRVDPTSTAFRYPTDADGKPSLPGSRHINLRNLSEVMARIGTLLDGASIGLSVYLDHKHEMEAEYRDLYP